MMVNISKSIGNMVNMVNILFTYDGVTRVQGEESPLKATQYYKNGNSIIVFKLYLSVVH